MFCKTTVAQQQQMALENLNQFEAQAGNWQIVGDVTMSRTIDIHQQHTDGKKKKKKRKKKKTVVPSAVSFTNGTGILLNLNDDEKRDNIVTTWEHGDIELEYEVMLPKGSNSGVYLQGRYEVQLLDSWGVKHPKFSDIGGVYENHSKDPATKMVGIPPTSNPSKAPGLWQKFKIHFLAPRFNTSGEKIENARLVSVDLNGVRIHTNVELAMPTGGPISKEEVPFGPLKIQGDHGPVAFRNIKYKLLTDSKVTLDNITYKSFTGDFKTAKEAFENNITSSGKAKKIDIALSGEENKYAIVFKGDLTIPKTDDYTLSVGYSGGFGLIVDNDTILKEPSESADGILSKQLMLSEGKHALTLYNFKSAGWRAPKLGLSIKGSSTNSKDFHEYDSFKPTASSVAPIFLDAENTPRLLRGFVSFKGESPKLSHTIGVGTPENVNYVYDLNTANLIGVWRGNFADVTPMWFQRGNATFVPRGAVQWTFLNQPLAELQTLETPFPSSANFENFTPKGYKIDKNSGLPVFKHLYKGVTVENYIYPDASNTYLIHRINFSKSGMEQWYQKIASGNILKLPDGSYAINDKQYYINILSNQTPIMRTAAGEQELLLPVDGSTITYEIIW